jgi:hypothetical protein
MHIASEISRRVVASTWRECRPLWTLAPVVADLSVVIVRLSLLDRAHW